MLQGACLAERGKLFKVHCTVAMEWADAGRQDVLHIHGIFNMFKKEFPCQMSLAVV